MIAVKDGGPACVSCGTYLSDQNWSIKSKSRNCRPCQSKKSVEWARINRQKKRDSNNKWHSKNAGNRAKKTALYRSRNPNKKSAHNAVQSALRNGSMKKMPCEVCGSTTRIHAHHDDYEKQLDVVWLCHSHHMERHSMLRAREATP